MDIISIRLLISMWTFSQTDPAFLAVGRNGRRSHFRSRHPVQRGAMDSSDWSNFGSPSTIPLVDIETIDLEARCPERWCHRCSSVLCFVSSGNPDFLTVITCPCFPDITHLSFSIRIVRPSGVSWGTEMRIWSSPGTCKQLSKWRDHIRSWRRYFQLLFQVEYLHLQRSQ